MKVMNLSTKGVLCFKKSRSCVLGPETIAYSIVISLCQKEDNLFAWRTYSLPMKFIEKILTEQNLEK